MSLMVLGRSSSTVAPLAGAWIEITVQIGSPKSKVVAPLAGGVD